MMGQEQRASSASRWSPRWSRPATAERFNGRYGPTFVLPEAVIPPVAANDCAEAVVELLRPRQQRYRELGEDGVMRRVLRDGAARAAELAEAKLRRAKANAGLFAP